MKNKIIRWELQKCRMVVGGDGERGQGWGGCWGPAELFVKLISRVWMLGDIRTLFIFGCSCDTERNAACCVYLFYTFSRFCIVCIW